ncbi:MAG: polyhydroxyalkanoate synthesis repressor PhaR [Silicimonas sp.]|nr:polyhydroxyalkanoate synthesis repressor PhaR [Silicimonas sp.]
MLRSIFHVAAQKTFDFSRVSRKAALQRIWGDIDVSDTLLIKRYASRRLYNTETSDYVTLEDIAGFIHEGRDVQIVDLKSGDDLTRQYLLQIVADHESRGENVLPLDVLTDLVRSYTSQAQSVVPQFLAMSFEMLREGQSKVMESMANPLSTMPGYDAMKAQQEAFMKAMTSGIGQAGWSGPSAEEDEASDDKKGAEDLDEIRAQLAAMQEQLAKMGKKS